MLQAIQANPEDFVGIALPPVELREDLDFLESRVAGGFNPAAYPRQVDNAVAHHAAIVEEVARRHGDFAIAGLAAAASVERGRIQRARLAFFGVADRPVLVGAASRDEARAAIEATQVMGSDLYPATYRRRLMRVLLDRVWSALER